MNRIKRTGIVFLTLAVIAGCASITRTSSHRYVDRSLVYPHTRTVDQIDDYHGTKVADPYRWLEDSENAEVREWVAKQNEFTRKTLAPFDDARERIKARLTTLYHVPYYSPPTVRGDRYFHFLYDGQKNHSVLYCRDGGLEAPARIILDPNQWSSDGSSSLDWWFASPDGSLIAYGRSRGGDEMSMLHVRDVVAGHDLDLAIPRTQGCNVAWDRDGRGFLYTRYPLPGAVPAGEERYYQHLFRHELGTDWKNDRRILGGRLSKTATITLRPLNDPRFILLTVRDRRTITYVHRAADDGFKIDNLGLGYVPGAAIVNERLLAWTTLNADRGRIVALDLLNLSANDPPTVVPQQDGTIKSFVVAGGKIVLSVQRDVRSHLLVYGLQGKFEDQIALPSLGTVSGLSAHVGRGAIFFEFTSFLQPHTAYHYDLKTRRLTPLPAIEPNVDVTQIEVRQVWFKSKDGTRVPMFVLHKKGIALNGKNATILYAYGFGGIGSFPLYSPGPLFWIESGGVWALANVRGGGEFGDQWRADAVGEHKQNSFDDAIAAAEKLIADGYTNPNRLAVSGGSAGGLLVGSVITQRPKLFRAAVCSRPLLDMIRYHKFDAAAYWTSEFGSAEKASEFKTLFAYSPYHNVADGYVYPAVLIDTGAGDTRVNPFHGRKMAARLQAVGNSDRPVLYWERPRLGHVQSSLGSQLELQASRYTFLMWQLGMLDTQK